MECSAMKASAGAACHSASNKPAVGSHTTTTNGFGVGGTTRLGSLPFGDIAAKHEPKTDGYGEGSSCMRLDDLVMDSCRGLGMHWMEMGKKMDEE